jgi:hypothetical protein
MFFKGGALAHKTVITTLVFAFVGILAYAASWLGAPASVAAPQIISAATPCPVAGCTQPDGKCHVLASDPDAPTPDGSFEMACPRISGCSSAECHAWERIASGHSKPSDISLNLWIIAPVALILGLVAMVRRMR